MERAKVERINELARLQKERELTAEEKAEQAALRAEYVADIRASFGGILDNTVVVRPDGTKTPLRESNQAQKRKKKS